MRIQRYSYSAAKLVAKEFSVVADALPLAADAAVTWLDLDGHLSTNDFEQLATAFKLHPVEIEEFIHKRHRPRIEFYTDHVVITLKMLRLSDTTKLFQSESVTIILGDHYVVTIQSGKAGDVFGPVREELNNDHSRTRSLDADYLLYRLLITVVNNYFMVLEVLDEQVEQLEDVLVKQTDQHAVNRLYRIKRELVILRKAVWPLREVILSIERTPLSLVQAKTQVYFRDVYEQTIQVIDTVESLRDLMSGMVEIYLSSLSNRMNAVIKVLTVITTIFMPLTLIVGIFGMNFKYLPWLDSPIAPWIVFGSMGVIVCSMIVVFKHKRWL